MAPKTRGGIKRVAKGPSKGASKSHPKRAKAHSPSPSPPPSPPHAHLPWPLEKIEHIDRYRVLSTRAISPTRYFDFDTLKELGLFDEVLALVSNVGWQSFVPMHYPTYKELTLEFLSSFSIDYDPPREEDILHVSFRCMGIDYTWTLAQLSTALNLPPYGDTHVPPTFRHLHAWTRFTGQFDYNASKSKSSSLHSHALRYIHRFMSHSIFGRGESQGVVTQHELYFLHCMVHPKLLYTAFWIARHIMHVQRSKAGKICIGGFITCIAQSLGFVAEAGRDTLITGSDKIDKGMLIHMGMCTYLSNGQFRLLGPDKQPLPPSNAPGDPAEQEIPQSQSIPTSTSGPLPFVYTAGASSSSHPPPLHSTSGWTLDSMMETITGHMAALSHKLDTLQCDFTIHAAHTRSELSYLRKAVATAESSSDEAES